MLGFNKGKLTTLKNNAQTHAIDSVDFGGVTYKLPQTLHFEENANEVDVYKAIVQILSKKYLKKVKA